MSLSKLSKLPPEALSSVLNNRALPLSRRFRLRLICNLWCDIIEDGLKKETSLVVCDKGAEYVEPKSDHLVLKSTAPNDGFSRPLSRLFPSLTQLSFSFGVDASLKALPSLLAHLDTTNLTALKLYSFLFNGQQIESSAIAAALTGLSALNSLILVGFQLGFHLLPHLGPVLSRLEKFICLVDSPDSGGILSSSLSSRCTHLWLFSDEFNSLNGPLPVQLSRNLTHLHLTYCDATIWQSISQMHTLRSLALDFTTYTDFEASLLSHLAPFSRLTQVKLLRLQYRAPLALPSKKETPLSSIKRLTLEVDFGDSPVDYPAFFSAISAWFPNLVKLTILTQQDSIPGIPASSLGKLSFSVELGIDESLDIRSADW